MACARHALRPGDRRGRNPRRRGAGEGDGPRFGRRADVPLGRLGSVVASSTDVAGWLNPGSYPTAADRLRIGWRDDLGDGARENSYFSTW